MVLEGATADANETTLGVVDPTADRTINLPNVSGTLPVLAAASTTAITSTPEEINLLDGVTSTTAELNILDGVTSTAAELNILDGVTSTATELNILDGSATTQATVTLAAGDGIVISDASDSETMKQALVSDIKTYVSSNTYPFVLAELDAVQETTTTQTAIGLNTTALVSMGSIFTINASDYIQTSEAGYYEVSVNTTWFKDDNSSRYLIFQIQKSSDGSSWSDVDGGRFIATAPSSSPDYAFGNGRAPVQLSANDMVRVTVKEDGNSSADLYLRSSGINDSYPGDTTIMIKKIGS